MRPVLTGAKLVRANRSAITKACADDAKQSYAANPSKLVVCLIEGDFILFTCTSQPEALSMTEVAPLATDVTRAIKGNMPNEVVAINHSTWNANDVTNNHWNTMKRMGVKLDVVWTTGVADNDGFCDHAARVSPRG